MPFLPRTLPASLICRSAPFLAPRLLLDPVAATRCVTPCATVCSRPPRSTFATRAKVKGTVRARSLTASPPSKQGRTSVPVSKELPPLLLRFHSACAAHDVKSMIDQYPNVARARLLDREETRRIAQILHTHVRNPQLSNATIADTFRFVQQMVQDIQARVLPSHPYTNVHLLSIFKECKKYGDGYAFWQWLLQQGEEYVNQAVYGSAIELMAYGGLRSLPELEGVYLEGLKRFPNPFAEYHLSPDAILPDRTQPFPDIRVPILLFQGILTARILNRDWRNAYLALDTALRIFPTGLPPRFFELFMIERPVQEAYTVYLIACRAGVVLKANHLTTLIKRLRRAMTFSQSQRDRLLILRAIANAIYAYLQAGGTPEGVHMSAFLNAFDAVLPEKSSENDYKGKETEFRNVLVTTAHEILSSLLRAGMPPQESFFGALIHLSGKLGVPDLLNSSLQDVKAAQVDIGPIGRRTVLTSAGLLRDQAFIEEYWTRITSAAESEGKQIADEDWITFVKACARADHREFFIRQLSEFEHAITGPLRDRVIALLDRKEYLGTPKKFELMELEDFNNEITALTGQFENIVAVVMSGQPLDLRKNPFYMFLDPTRSSLGSPADLRTVYDELTVDPHQPPAPPPHDSANTTGLSPTGIPLDELRFLNWVSVVDLMEEAEHFEDMRRRDITQRIKEGTPVRRSLEAIARIRRNPNQISIPLPGIGNLRRKIKQLRTPSPRDPSVVRKIVPQKETRNPHVPHLRSNPLVDSDPTLEPNSSASAHSSEDSLAQSPTSTRPPSLRYYVSLESDHSAPYRPLAARKKASHHALRLQPAPNTEQQAAGSASKPDTYTS